MRLSSFELWFLLLLSLNVFDILTTVPAYEANPVTLYAWKRVGFFLAAWFKIGLVLFFGLLFIVAQKVASPKEWSFAEKVFRGLLKILVAFYVFIVLTTAEIYTF
ncbi:MAG: hypothetical protein ACETV1_05955 [Candidatus Bathyarchaeia archaeon]